MKFYRREVAKDMRERTEVVDKWREVAVFQGSQLTLSRTRSKMGLSKPSSQELQSHMGFLLIQGARVGLILLNLKSANFFKLLLNLAV